MSTETLEENTLTDEDDFGTFGLDPDFNVDGIIVNRISVEDYSPRIFHCPSCDKPNQLTQEDIDCGYQCRSCDNEEE